MNTEYLRNIRDVNLETLPIRMREQFDLLRFKFDIARGGAYLTKNVFKNIYCDVPFVHNAKALEKRIMFNDNMRLAQEEYKDGYFDALHEPDFLIGITGIENQVFEVFSGVYERFEKINNPPILGMKQTAQYYNELNFLKKNLYDYGKEVGHFIRCWTIILNNPLLFEGIFEKHYGSKQQKPESEKMYFKVGLLLAQGRLYRKTIERQGIKTPVYVYDEQQFDSISSLAKHASLTRQYVNDSLNEIDSHHNIFSNPKFMGNIMSFCEKQSIVPHPDFAEKFRKLEAKNV